ncbi:MAG: M67 family metallopeptidase [Gammaproteobacteria bacterium]|nr:M67 family metallopeptidase [Gammaproteobacteria bacterium]
MTTIKLSRTLVNQLLTQAQHDADNETCGLVAAKNNIPTRIYPVSNIAGDKKHLFEMDPGGQIQAMKAMREAGEELFAIYHSHPDAPASPSATDLQQASYRDALYLIISLNTKGVLDMRAYKIHEDDFEPVELVI